MRRLQNQKITCSPKRPVNRNSPGNPEIDTAGAIVIGDGADISAAAGFICSGERFAFLKGKSDGLPIELFQNIEEGLKAFSLIFFVSA